MATPRPDPLDVLESGKLWPSIYMMAARVSMEAGWQLPSEAHRDQYQLLVLTSGELQAIVEGMRYTAGPGDVMLYSAGMVHAERNTGQGPIHAIFIGFCPPPAARCWFPVKSADPAGRVHYLARWMLDQMPATTPARHVVMQTALGAILAEHCTSEHPHQRDLTLCVREHVTRHLTEPLSLDDLAAAAGLSRFYFVRAFRKAAGQSPMRYVQQMRLDAAHGMLMTSDAPLKQIASATGFADEFHLSRTFRRLLGRSPSALRRSS